MQALNFVFSCFTKGELPKFYKSISSTNTSRPLLVDKKEKIITEGILISVLEDVPGYLNVVPKELSNNLSRITVKFYPGFLINFDGIKSLDEYLNLRFGRSSRYKLRRDQKKLEDIFSIKYHMYYGSISKMDYDYIFKVFYKLLEERSLEKGIKNNRNLKTKDFYYKTVYPMILDKRASLYVIYNDTVPIDICLNFHLNDVIFQFIRTYDIDYSKFNTGYTDLMKQIEWCLENKVKTISFSKGDFYWKRRWCNTVYNYSYDIFYDNTSILARVKANLYASKLQLKQYLREKGIIKKYHEIKTMISNKIFISKEIQQFNYTVIEYSKQIENLESIDYTHVNYSFLKRSIYEFLYNTNEKEKDIKTYKLANRNKMYLIVGKENKQIISVK